MKFRSCWLIFTLVGLSLTSCGQQKPSEIAKTVENSIVLISYKDKGGHGTGFIVPGKVADLHGQQASLSPQQQAALQQAAERVAGGVQINTFRWGIPIKTYLANQSDLIAKADEGKKQAENKEETSVLTNPLGFLVFVIFGKIFFRCVDSLFGWKSGRKRERRK
jgi:hypothetical protein